jgi:hypothetical protein
MEEKLLAAPLRLNSFLRTPLQTQLWFVGFQVLTAVVMKVAIFWDIK